MPAAIRIAPIPPISLAEWHAFQAELAGPRRIDWVQSQRRRGIRREVVWLDEVESTAYYFVEAVDPAVAYESLAAPVGDFEVWLAERLDHLHPQGVSTPIQVFDSSPKPGAWRGLAGRS